MAERERESSVIVSLNELLRMEEQRRRDVADADRAGIARLEREREAAAARAKAEEEQRRIEGDTRRRDSALRSAVEGAQIDAAKATQIEKTRLEILVRMQADEIASRDAHARELASMLAAQKGRTTTIVSAALAALAIAVAVVAIFAMSPMSRRGPVADPIAVPTPRDTGDLDLTKKKIAALEEELLRLRATPPPSAPVQSAAPKPFRPREPSSPVVGGGTKCPPGVKGIPMCP